MNAREIKIVKDLGEIWNQIQHATQNEQKRLEAQLHIHALQNMILALPTIRQYPDFLNQ